jgi:putative ABC transport system permease protein
VSPEYFHTLHIGIEQGRQFSESDVSGSEPVVMVSRKLADRSWPGQNPIGRRLKLKTRTDSAWRTVVGIVEDIQYDWTDPGPEIVIYAPYRQLSMNSTFAILRSSNGPGSLLYASSRSKITEVDAQQPVFQMKSLEGVIHDAVAALIYVAAFVAILGMIAIILTSTGIYGVLGQVVNERMQEIRLRLALGAQPMDVAKLILKYGAFLMSIGLGIGLSVSFLLGRILSSMLASIRPMILTSSLEIAAVLVFVSALTCYLPARHASSTDPGTILREN